ncbi:molybdenum cofactor biosynthesis protein MoaC [Aeropyrum pernix K1]|uniref:Probable cyclic pyranopterin monophosphate synthase n=2 Tax=Aeropyrum pernix TaxID=56636 RepID=MOAC_AERPE|nr:cyclic pyranopterin monophosphate synthase MoaC [Aeropyrum pernix]Q9YCA4.2 RecName: Full=Probable cyclic pyranopterin monophosphate synthase; AltName: Full=Molybdenum cofactor biosynthesis protein C [Aeropyrum pernix K1]BAA80344.2 molybdenum cofactor biosynthesis protein MoaC [Aeropyrum pernix K1]GBF08932.1 probable cyclic pyranopterin monophosphate synthase accessory protein [Aeropyrum pernix]
MSGAGMVDITAKEPVRREAVASGFISLKRETVKAIREGRVEKGDVISVASVAAVLAVKETPRLIPLTHPIPIEKVEPEVRVRDDGVEVRVRVATTAKTGVEMEALAGVTAALLTVWDMVKSLEKDETGNYPDTVITGVKVEVKRKG